MNDPVHRPAHYTETCPLEAIEIIRLTLNSCPWLTPFEAYCFGSELKYRLRAGFKNGIEEDIRKALQYRDFRLSKQGIGTDE